MAKTIIIVEDDSDKFIYSALIKHLGLNHQIDIQESPEIDWKIVQDEANSDKPTALISALKSLSNDFSKEKYNRVGIIRDLDNKTQDEKLQLVNTALQNAYSGIFEAISVDTLTKLFFSQNSTQDKLAIEFSCHFVGLDGKGEIEDILKAIKTQDSPIADCVDKHLPLCLKLTDEEIRDKELVKLWFNNYQRYDTLPKNLRKNPFTTTKYIMEFRLELFDFDKELPELKNLKSFLKMMVQPS